MSIQAFTIAIAQSTLDDLRARLARTRWPDELAGAGWDYGTNVGYLKELVNYWQHTFDWRAADFDPWLAQHLHRAPAARAVAH